MASNFRFLRYAGDMFLNNYGVAVYKNEKTGMYKLVLEKRGKQTRVYRHLTREEYLAIPENPYNGTRELLACFDLLGFE